MVSVSASMATMAFNRFFRKNVKDYISTIDILEENTYDEQKIIAYREAMKQGALFDARVFNIPKEEVTNCIYWRQLDATRNSIQMVGQANFSQRELQGKSCNDIQDMLMLQKNINWNDFEVYKKRGTCVIKKEYYVRIVEDGTIEEISLEEAKTLTDEVSIRTRWVIDKEIPIFKNEGRDYIENLIYVGE